MKSETWKREAKSRDLLFLAPHVVDEETKAERGSDVSEAGRASAKGSCPPLHSFFCYIIFHSQGEQGVYLP